jgi:hypothetical protein
VVSTGSDGKIVVYEERWITASQDGDTTLPDASISNVLSKWVVVADIENAHDVFEINHVTWAPRSDKARRHADEEVILSTGDDGEVKVWTLDK